MSRRRLLATTARVLTQLRHDPRTVALLFVVPSLLMGLLSWICTIAPASSTTSGGRCSGSSLS